MESRRMDALVACCNTLINCVAYCTCKARLLVVQIKFWVWVLKPIEINKKGK